MTSSVALCQPLVAFLQEAFGIGRRAAALVCGGAMIVLGLPIVLWLKAGYLDQYDFWVGTFGLVVFSLVEVILFAWMFGGGNMWSELRRDADLRVPRVYYYVIRYVVPLLLIGLLGGWLCPVLTTMWCCSKVCRRRTCRTSGCREQPSCW